MLADTRKKYEEVYSEFLQEMVVYHNLQSIYFRIYARDSGFALRKSSKRISELHRQLRELSLVMYKERKIEIKKKKEERRSRLLNLKQYNPKLRNKNNEHNNTTTTTTV